MCHSTSLLSLLGGLFEWIVAATGDYKSSAHFGISLLVLVPLDLTPSGDILNAFTKLSSYKRKSNIYTKHSHYLKNVYTE